MSKKSAVIFILIMIFIFSGCGKEKEKYAEKKPKPVETFSPVPLKTLQVKYGGMKPVHFSPWIRGVKKKIDTEEKILVLSLDACGGPGGNGYDAGLIEYIRKEKIPASLFLTGRWIRRNKKTALELAKDDLFSIENHGTRHRPASVAGLSKYGIRGTASIADLYYEINAASRMIHEITGRVPRYFRPGTAFIDDVAIRIAGDMGYSVLSFTVAPGDAEHELPLKIMINRFMTRVHPGAVVLMHMNHPRGKSRRLLENVLPQLRNKGYRFVRLEDCRHLLK